MPFKFKLSKRLALIKASLAASVVLALACERDLTDPQPPRNPLTQVITSADLTPLPVASVLASGDDGNIPQNTLDNNLATRWSASGDGQWIRYDLGAVTAVGPVTIAWYRGTEWASAFDIEVSLDSLTWTRAFTGRSSGQTLQPERYDFPTVPGRYVRIVGHGQWSGTTQLSLWNSITETAIYGSAAAPVTAVPVASAIASGDDGNIPQNTLDNNLATRWSASGDGQWIRYDLGAVMAVGPVNIAWYRGTEWASAFDIEVSLDSLTWTRVFTGRSSGQTLQPERYDFPVVPGHYVRIVGHGQWSGTTQLSLWNSITETAIYVSAAVRIDSVPVASVTVSPTSGSARIGATVQLTGVTKDSAGNLLTRRTVSWMTSNASVATVSAGGSDGNPCTAAAPCYTLQRVSQLMNPGDNAHVAAGNYTWSYSANRVTKSGTATALLTYISDTKWGAKIYGSDCSPITNDGDYVQIINFDVTGSCNQGITTNGNYSRIIGNRVHDMPGTALTGAIVVDCCSYTKTGNQVIGNVVDNIGPWGQVNQTHGIYLAGPGNSAMNNIVTRAASACIQTYHGATRLTIGNNVVANCGQDGLQISGDPAITSNDYTTVDETICVNV